MNGRPLRSNRRWIVGLVFGLVCATAVYLVLVFYIQKRSLQIKFNNAALMTSLPEVIEQLLTDPLTAPSLLNLTYDYSFEYVPQTAGVADAGETSLPPQWQVLDSQLGNSVVLAWEPAAGQTYDGVLIYRAKNSSALESPATEDALQQFNKSNGQWLDKEVENDQEYFYGIQSFRTDQTGHLIRSAITILSAIPTDSTPPAPPTRVLVTNYVGETEETTETDSSAEPVEPITALTISWEQPIGDDVVEYRLYRSTERGVIGTELQRVATDTTEINDQTVAAGVTYYYTVTAVDAVGNESAAALGAGPTGNDHPFVTSVDEAITLLQGNFQGDGD